MHKLSRKLMHHRKAATRRAMVQHMPLKGKLYHTDVVVENKELHWCDVMFRRGNQVYNTTFLGLSVALDDALFDAVHGHPEYKLLPRRRGKFNLPEYAALCALEHRLHKEGVTANAGVAILSDYRYGTGLLVTFPTMVFTEDSIVEFIDTWDGTNKDWGTFNSAGREYHREVWSNELTA